MPLPLSIQRLGVKTPQEIAKKRKRLMIGTQGESEAGKTEFICSAPGYGIVNCLDRGHEGMLDNPKPPDTRQDSFLFKVFELPRESQVEKPEFLKAWINYRDAIYEQLKVPEVYTIGIDTDSVAWELQLLAEFGKTTQIPQLMRTSVNISRRGFTTRLFDSGKNIIGTNLLKDRYETLRDETTGRPILKDGKEQNVRTGKRERQGFPDQTYLWQVQLEHFVVPSGYNKLLKKVIPRKYGIRVLKCKINGELTGAELTGSECNFLSLALAIYPSTTSADWGYK